VDVGQVLFGGTTALTGDSAVGHYLHEATGRRWIDFDTECEAGCGIIPIEYRNTSLIHALQWVIGLEWFLLVKNPWQMALTTDHPNGATFWRYPEIIHLLMSRDRRQEMLHRLPEAVRSRSILHELNREYTLAEIAIVTRAAPARILGLGCKGHLGVGADADVTIYDRQDDITAMFTLPRWVIKAGQVIVENGQLRRCAASATWRAATHWEVDFVKSYRPWFENHYSMRLANFGVHENAASEHVRVIG
jgi:formylmethanofuran dehydrogenase subunit A